MGSKTKIPFSFNVGGQKFPAGGYTLMPEWPLQNALLLRNLAGQARGLHLDQFQAIHGRVELDQVDLHPIRPAVFPGTGLGGGE
jgi:hypothetical protein